MPWTKARTARHPCPDNGSVPHVVRTHPDHPIVEVAVRGAINDPEVLGIFDAARVLQLETGIGDVLVDCSDMSRSLTYTEVIALATILADRGVMPHWRQAIIKLNVVPTNRPNTVSEAACSNRGLKVKVFRDHDSALEWLMTTDATEAHADSDGPSSGIGVDPVTGDTRE